MDKAIWKNRIISAQEIYLKYIDEKTIRLASNDHELVCCETNCPNPILEYCHGPKRRPHFRHANGTCEYQEYEKNYSEDMIKIKFFISTELIKQGFDIEVDVKIIEGHYTPILIKSKETKIALELTEYTRAKTTESLKKKYEEKGINIQWIVVGSIPSSSLERDLTFIKRRELNESKNKILLCINNECTEITAHVYDDNEYSYKTPGYSDIFSEKTNINELTIFEGQLIPQNILKNFQKWLIEKRNKSQEHIQYPHKPAIKKLGSKNKPEIMVVWAKNHTEIKNLINQQDNRVYTQEGEDTYIRWVKCRICQKIINTDDCWMYGGPGTINIGECRTCGEKRK